MFFYIDEVDDNFQNNCNYDKTLTSCMNDIGRFVVTTENDIKNKLKLNENVQRDNSNELIMYDIASMEERLKIAEDSYLMARQMTGRIVVDDLKLTLKELANCSGKEWYFYVKDITTKLIAHLDEIDDNDETPKENIKRITRNNQNKRKTPTRFNIVARNIKVKSESLESH